MYQELGLLGVPYCYAHCLPRYVALNLRTGYRIEGHGVRTHVRNVSIVSSSALRRLQLSVMLRFFNIRYHVL